MWRWHQGCLLTWPLCLWGVLLAGGDSDAGLVVASGKGSGGKRPKGALAVTKDIERRVTEAGGQIQGVLVASLSWTSADDLDLHMALPGGREISYRNKQADGGELDVDMCVQGRHSGKCADRPVENIVFMDEPPAGRYKVYVQNFNYHLNTLPQNMQVARMQEGVKTSSEERKLRLSQDRPVIFDLLVKVHGTKKLFEGLCTPAGKTHAASDVTVFEFDYDPSKEDEDERLIPHFAASGAMECEVYQRKLLEAGAQGGALSSSSGSKAAATRQGSSGVKAKEQGRKKNAAPKQKQGGSKGRARQDAKDAALQAVRSGSRDALLGKPASALRSLLADLGSSCKGCMEKGELVDKLLDVAGVRQEL
eukprot:TRINITY_DN54311_c0_g1_i1.p1 TRINITY_DN54311_c0_g1~~TRINITY_DN54311_c0_g1_i1.p1  ORF type:complete len:364 (+),score=77.74 TRINITY_DN54311_c0_g1_i1:51-1142(+)